MTPRLWYWFVVVVCGKIYGKMILLESQTDVVFEVAAPLETHAKVGKLKSEFVFFNLLFRSYR